MLRGVNVNSRAATLLTHAWAIYSMDDGLYRVAVVGSVACGKSSIIKRLVCHRFDTLRTANDTFMGLKSDGRYVTRLTMPGGLSSLVGTAGPNEDVLIELHDQLQDNPTSLLNARLWHDVAVQKPDTVDGAAEEDVRSDGKGETNGKGANEVTPTASGAGKRLAMDGKMAPEPPPHPLMVHQFRDARRQKEKEARRNLTPGKANPITKEHGTHGWVVVYELGRRDSFEEAKRIVSQILRHARFDGSSKRCCAVSIVLVGNKLDDVNGRTEGESRPVHPHEVLELVAASVVPGQLLGQLKKQKLDRIVCICYIAKPPSCHPPAAHPSPVTRHAPRAAPWHATHDT